MAKPNKQVIIDQIIKLIEKGKSYASVLAQSGTKWHISKRTFDRYWKIANEQHTERQQGIKSKLAEVDAAAAIEARKRDIMTVEERKEVLTQIARGEIPLTKPMVVDGAIELVPVVPDWMDRKSAIAELNKMEGDYAPVKTKSEVSIIKLGKELEEEIYE